MSIFSNSNPWDEDVEFVGQKVTADLIRLAKMLEMHKQPKGALALADIVRSVAKQIQDDVQIYRANRQLLVIQVPQLTQGVEAFVDLKQETGKADEILQTEVTLLAQEVMTALEAVNKTTIASKTQLARTAVDVARRGRATEVLETPVGFAQIGGRIKAFTRVSAEATQTAFLRTADSTTGRASAALNALRLTGNMAAGESLDLVHGSVLTRVNALRRTLENTASSALIGGLIATLIFPPAATFVVGWAVLKSPDEYNSILSAEMSDHERKKALRRAGASDEIATELAKLKGAKVIRTETDHLSIEIDLTTGQFDGTIMSGRYTGQRLTKLNQETIVQLRRHAPDQQTKDLLMKFESSTNDRKI